MQSFCIRALPFLLVSAICGLGCRGTGPSLAPEGAFRWDSSTQVPRSRVESSVEWLGSFEMKEAIDKSRADGKPILCYLSKYEEPETSLIEGILLADSNWGRKVKERFVTWEVNYWENPSLALYILEGAGRAVNHRTASLPALVALKVGESDKELKALDVWEGMDVLSFPGHCPRGVPESERGIVIDPDSDQAEDELARLEYAEPKPFVIGEVSLAPLDVYSNLKDQLGLLVSRAGNYSLFAPELVLYLALQELEEGNLIQGVRETVVNWVDSNASLRTGSPFLSSLCFVVPRSLVSSNLAAIEPTRNLIAMQAATAEKVDMPVEASSVFGELYDFLVTDEGFYGGGIPAYIDIPELNLPAGGAQSFGVGLSRGIMGPRLVLGRRDIPWVNAYTLALWVELVNAEPTLGDVELPSGQTAREFLNVVCPIVVKSLESSDEGEGGALLTFCDKVYILRLILALHQMNGEGELLSKADEMVRSFSLQDAEKWFKPSDLPILSDFAVALFHYSLLRNDESSRELALWITEKLLEEMGSTHLSVENVKLMYAYDVVHEEGILVSVSSNLVEPRGWELLRAGLEGWDPRKVAHIVEMGGEGEGVEPVAQVFVGGSSYPGVTDPQALRELLIRIRESTRKVEKSGS